MDSHECFCCQFMGSKGHVCLGLISALDQGEQIAVSHFHAVSQCHNPMHTYQVWQHLVWFLSPDTPARELFRRKPGTGPSGVEALMLSYTLSRWCLLHECLRVTLSWLQQTWIVLSVPSDICDAFISTCFLQRENCLALLVTEDQKRWECQIFRMSPFLLLVCMISE